MQENRLVWIQIGELGWQFTQREQRHAVDFGNFVFISGHAPSHLSLRIRQQDDQPVFCRRTLEACKAATEFGRRPFFIERFGNAEPMHQRQGQNL